MLALFYLKEEILSHFYPTCNSDVGSHAPIIETSSEVLFNAKLTRMRVNKKGRALADPA